MRIAELEKKIDDNKIFWWFCVFFLGITLRFIVMIYTNHGDFVHWCMAGEFVSQGKNVYASMKNYNYAPVYSVILGIFFKTSSFFNNTNILIYKFLIVSFLITADCFIAQLIVKETKKSLLGMLFFLNPVSIVVEGQNNQFDNIALIIAAYAVMFISQSSHRKDITINDFIGIILLSLSLTIKHIMWAFPLWILFNKNIDTSKKFLYAFIPPMIFLASFVPYWSEGAQGIIRNVFMYRSGHNYPLFAVGLFRNYLGINLFPQQMHFLLYIALMFLSAYIFRYETLKYSFLVYTMAMVCCSSGIFGTYFVIPLLALFTIFRYKALLFFLPEATRFLEKGNGNGNIMYTLMAWLLLYYIVQYYINFSEARKRK